MKKLIIIIGCCLLFTCKKQMPDPVCKLAFRAVTGTAIVIASTLDCKNVGAIAADLADPFIKMKLCDESKMQSTLSDIICPQISTIATSLISASIPTNWECTANELNAIVKQEIITKCGMLIK